jgi:5-methylcytosine-specific restriction endonuclease McrA
MRSDNRKVICAGCQEQYFLVDTIKYRKKRCCQKEECYVTIDKKVAHFNYRKQQKKMEKGTFRHGVPISIKQEIIKRDNNTCKECFNECAEYKAQVHHIIPVSHGGEDEYNNLILLCSDCHNTIHQSGWENYVTELQNKIYYPAKG